MGSYVNTNLKSGIGLNGNDLLDYDPDQVKKWLNSLPEGEQEIIRAMIKIRMMPAFDLTDYAKNYGRPSLADRPYMTCENDGMPYLGHGHSPACDGTLTYTENIYTREKICWCMWASKTAKDKSALWKHYKKTGKIGLNKK